MITTTPTSISLYVDPQTGGVMAWEDHGGVLMVTRLGKVEA